MCRVSGVNAHERVVVACLVAVGALAWLRLRSPAAVPAINDDDVAEDANAELQARLGEAVKWFHAHGARRTIASSDGQHDIPTWTFAGQRSQGPVLLMLTGWSESAERYCDIVHELAPLFSHVVVIDHRSQGSSRKTDPFKSHVDSFECFIDDAALVVDRVALPLVAPGSQLVLFGFSMGGLVAAYLAARRSHDIDGLILVAPALEVKTGWPPAVLGALLTVATLLGFGRAFVPGHPSSMDGTLRMPPLSRTSSSTTRMQFYQQLRQAQLAHVVNGMSVRHLRELVAWRFTDFAAIKQQQVLVLTAAKDEFVENAAVGAFVAALGAAQCRHVHYLDAKHEILHERESIRAEAMAEIKRFVLGS